MVYLVVVSLNGDTVLEMAEAPLDPLTAGTYENVVGVQ